MIEVVTEPKELSHDDLRKIFHAVFPSLGGYILDKLEFYDGAKFVKITCNHTGYSIILWENYDVTIDSTIKPITHTPTLAIVATLMEIGAIKTKIKVND